MIKLNQNKGFNWYHNENIWVKGAFFNGENNYFEKNDLPGYFASIDSYDNFIEAVKSCNGIFTVVIFKNSEIWCAIDRCATFPLFYYKYNNEWVITDDTTLVKEHNAQYKLNLLQKEIYSGFGHTFADKTLIENVFKTQCAQSIRLINGNESHKDFYHTFSTQKFNKAAHNNLINQGLKVFEASFTRLISSLNKRTAVVPLSGGFDSRMIVAGLKKQGYNKVICFTYGKKENNHEYNLSKKVAEALGYKWIFVEYNQQLFNGYSDTGLFKEYVHYMSQLGNMFYLQEYFAVKYLQENKLVPEDSVFLPGHSGDLIGGSQLIKAIKTDTDFNEIPKAFIAKKNIFAPFTQKQTLHELIKNEISNVKPNNGATVMEELDIREKISKIIFNSSRVFDFFNYEKRFPFWDTALLNFFLTLPLAEREMKKLYDEILVEHYFKPLNINFSKELQPLKRELFIQKIKDRIKKFAPLKFKEKLLIKKDWINYYNATRPLISEMKENGYQVKFYGKSFNEILINYYLYLLTKK